MFFLLLPLLFLSTLSDIVDLPPLFFHLGQSQTIRLSNFVPPSFSDFKIESLDPPILDVVINESLETTNFYNFASYQSLTRTKFFKETSSLFFLHPNKFIVYFIGISQLTGKIEIKSFKRIKLNVTEGGRPDDVVCYDICLVEGMVVMDCDATYEVEEQAALRQVFLIYEFSRNSTDIILKESIFNDVTSEQRTQCIRRMKYKDSKILRFCEYKKKSPLTNFKTFEIYQFFKINDKIFISLLLSENVNSYEFLYAKEIKDAAFHTNSSLLIMAKKDDSNDIIYFIELKYDYLFFSPIIYKESLNFPQELLIKISKISTSEKRIFTDFTNNNNENLDYSNIYLILTNNSIYSLIINESATLKLKLAKLVTVKEASEPIYLFYTRNYLIIRFNKFLKFYRINGFHKRKVIEFAFYHFFQSPQFFFFQVSLLMVKDVESIAILSKSITFAMIETEIIWSLNLTQISMSKLTLKCCSQSSPSSLQSPSTLLLSSSSLKVRAKIQFWDLDDTNLYFFPLDKTKQLNETLINSEKVYVNMENYVVGPLMSINIKKVSPVKENFEIKSKEERTIDFYAISKGNPNINFQNFKTQTSFLEVEEDSISVQFFWRCDRDKSFYFIKCFEKNYVYSGTVSSCVVVLKKKQLEKIIKLQSYLNKRVFLDENKKLFLFDQTMLNESISFLDKSIICEDFYIVETSGLLFCITREKKFLNIYKISEEFKSLDLIGKNVDFGIKDLYLEQLFIDLFDFNCLILKSGKSIYFIEVVQNYNDDIEYAWILINLDRLQLYKFVVKSIHTLSSPDLLLLLVKHYLSPSLLVIAPSMNKIEEYSLSNPLDPKFIRIYPFFEGGGEIVQARLVGNRYLSIVSCNEKKNNFISYYDLQEQTGSSMKRRVEFDEDEKVYQIQFNLPESSSSDNKIYGNYLLLKRGDMLIKTIENMKLVGSIKHSFLHPDFKKGSLSFNVTIFFENPFNSYKIFHSFVINFVPKDVLVERIDEKAEVQAERIEEEGEIKFVLAQNVFKGPIMDFKVEKKENKYYQFQAYLKPTNNFIDYKAKTDKYGELVSMTSFDDSLIVLSENILTFYSIHNFEVKAQYRLIKGYKCNKLQHHNSLNYMAMFCINKNNYAETGIILEIFEYAEIDKIASSSQNKTGKTKNNQETCVIELNINPDQNKTTDFVVIHKLTKEIDSLIIDTFVISSLVFEGNIFVLVNEFNSWNTVLYVYNLASLSNDYNMNCMGKLIFNETFLADSSFAIKRTIKSFSVFKINSSKDQILYGFLILDDNNLTYFEAAINIENSKNDINNNNCEIPTVRRVSKIEINEEIKTKKTVFNTISIIESKVYQEPQPQPQPQTQPQSSTILIVALLSTNLQIYEINIRLQPPKYIFNTTISYIFRKFYSCIFINNYKALAWKEYVGSFCKREYVDSQVTSTFNNYFLLYKKEKGSFESNPIRALPLLIDKYDFEFYSRSFQNTTSSFILLPSYLNLFQEFQIDPNLTLISFFKGKEDLWEKSIMLTAFNDFSNCSVRVLLKKDIYGEKEQEWWGWVVGGVGLLLLIIFFLLYRYRRYFKPRPLSPGTFNEERYFENENFETEKKGSLPSTALTLLSEKIEKKKERKKEEESIDIMVENLGFRISMEEKIKRKLKGFNKNF